MKRALSFEDVRGLADRVPELRDIILVGGQALNFWADHFRIVTTATEARFGAALSDDIDFIGTATAATRFAEAAGGRVQVAGQADPHTPNTALVTLEIEGEQHLIDFLGSLAGFTAEEFARIRRWAASVRVRESADARLLVMHPVHCLESQLENVYGAALDRRSGPDGARHARRVRLAVEACRRTVLERLELDEQRDALNIVEKVHVLSLLETSMRARAQDRIEVADAIPFDRMPAAFRSRRAPQLRRELEIGMAKHDRLLARRAAVAAKRRRRD